MSRVLAAIGLAALLAMPTAVFAADHQVLMLNKDSEGRPMQFEPAFLQVAPGDTVTFVNGAKKFSWKFDTTNHGAVPLAKIAPADFGVVASTVYVSRNDYERGG